MLISQAKPMAHEITGASDELSASVVILISVCNGVGRLFWAWLSDAISRRWVFLVMFLLQAVLFFLMPEIRRFGWLTLSMMVVALCYGGGFGTMPAFAADYFGPKNAGKIYGLMLSARSAGGVLGPILIAQVRDRTHHYSAALAIIAVVMLVSAALPLLARPPRVTSSPRTLTADPAPV